MSEEELEKQRMRDAAISVIALCNTVESYKQQKLERDNPYWTPTYNDVCEAVLREITLIAENKKLQTQLTQERQEFKNFHRLICEASNYGHDDIDWKRDQLSLAEHIRTKYKESE